MRAGFFFVIASLAGSPAGEEPPKKPDRVVRIVAERFVFSPSRIKVRQGGIVELVLTSDDTEHGFLLPAANINTLIRPRSEVRIRFLARQKGTFGFACSRPCGAGHFLMRGDIVVE